MLKTVLVPPDGGYGWIIVIASGLNNFVAIPMILSYGMVFQGAFHHLGLSATQTSIIININSAIGMLTGLANGPLLNNFGFRIIALIGAFFMTIGIFLMSFANTWTTYVLSYGFLASIGVGLTVSSNSLAINTYFKEKRDKAVSLSMTITGLGPIIVPQIINILLDKYGARGATMILSGVCAQSFIGACLLQPVQKHMRSIVVEEMKELPTKLPNEENDADEEADYHNDEVYHTVPALTSRFALAKVLSQMDRLRYSRKDSTTSMFCEHEGVGVYGLDSTLIGSSVISLDSVRIPSLVRQVSKTKYQWWKSASTVNLASSYNIFDDKATDANTHMSNMVYNELSIAKEKETRLRRMLRAIITIFDLKLLKDLVYCNIMIGISLAIFAEINFSILTVFILIEYGMSITEVAEFLSIVATADLVFRFLAPYIGDVLNKPPRVMYLLTLVVLILIRSVMFTIDDTNYLYGVAIALGCTKGVRSVYMYLVIPTHVPLNRLASASGIQMLVNGLIILIGGPLIGLVRDLTGSYQVCIVVINAVSLLTVTSWTIEYIIKCLHDKPTSEPEKVPEQENTLLNTL